MGYIDSDAHVIECDHTWDFFDPKERDFKPTIRNGYWKYEDIAKPWPTPPADEWLRVFPPGSVTMENPENRVSYMDDLGIDVEVLFPTFWISEEITNPVREAAMARSYNRWMADATADSNGRLAWTIVVPTLAHERAAEEMEFGKAHGGVSLFMLGRPHGMSLANPTLFPIYAKAQELDLAITVHVGGDGRVSARDGFNFLHNAILPVPGAFHTVVTSGIAKRFPELRWGFIEAGASWIPYLLQEAFRADETTVLRSFSDWREPARAALRENKVFVSCQMDDDLGYLLDYTGPDVLVHGTDYGHLDLGSDPNGLHTIASRRDLDPVALRHIVDVNGRTLYGIDPAFQPAPPPTSEGLALTPGAAGHIPAS